jgi:hypothetical protein
MVWYNLHKKKIIIKDKKQKIKEKDNKIKQLIMSRKDIDFLL